MKRFIIALLASALFVDANAQKNNEVYLAVSPMTLETSVSSGSKKIENETYTGCTLGYNHIFDLKQGSDLKFVLGANIFYGTKDLETVTLDDGSSASSATEQFGKLRVPLSLKYIFSTKETIGIEPYAGLYIDYNIESSAEVKYGSTTTTIDYFKEYDINRFETGFLVGCDLRIKSIVIGFDYNKSFTNYYSKNGTNMKWSGFDIKLGYRF